MLFRALSILVFLCSPALHAGESPSDLTFSNESISVETRTGADLTAHANASEQSCVQKNHVPGKIEYGSGNRVRPPIRSQAAVVRELEFATTEGVQVVGSKATARARSYEAGVRNLYGDLPAGSRTYAAPHNASGFGTADNVASIGGKEIAIEAKYTDNWGRSIFNPSAPQGQFPWAVAERTRMVTQAKNYNAAFDEILYHTNSHELANYYTQLLSKSEITNFRFIVTPAIR
jgi:hypothetical protein